MTAENPDWDEYCRLLNAGVSQESAATLVLEQHQRRGQRDRREHGTEKGYQQHRYDGTDACPACLAAHSRHNHQVEFPVPRQPSQKPEAS